MKRARRVAAPNPVRAPLGSRGVHLCAREQVAPLCWHTNMQAPYGRVPCAPNDLQARTPFGRARCPKNPRPLCAQEGASTKQSAVSQTFIVGFRSEATPLSWLLTRTKFGLARHRVLKHPEPSCGSVRAGCALWAHHCSSTQGGCGACGSRPNRAAGDPRPSSISCVGGRQSVWVEPGQGAYGRQWPT